MKQTRTFLVLSALVLLVALPGTAHAQKPIQLSLFDPVQIFNRSTSITGVRLNVFYTNNRDVTGLDLSFIGVSRATGNFKGVQWALGNWVEGGAVGWQGGFVNYTAGQMTGLQSGFINVAHQGGGIQLGMVGWSDNFTGVQWSFLFNNATEVRGLQFGLVNYTKKLHGIQIGLINIAANGFLPVFPIINAAF